MINWTGRGGIEDFRDLNDPELRRAIERRGDFFVVEGLPALEALLASRYPLRSVLVAEPKADAVHAALARAGVGPDRQVAVRPAPEVAEIAGFDFHRGVLATASRLPPLPLADVTAPPARRLLVIEGVNDHENLGALFRNAAACATDGVVLDPTTADPLYRRSIRVSMGHVLRMPWARLEDGLDEGIAALRTQRFVTAALTPSPEAEPIEALAAEPPKRLAFLVGSEGPGLSAAALESADHQVRIPIAPDVDSLNVATAAAIALHHLSGL